MSRSLGFIFSFTVFLGLTSCSDDDLPKYFLLDKLRVVAATMSGSAAEFSPGDSASVSFFLADPKGAGRALSFTVVGCVDPGVSLGAKPTCDGNPTTTTIDSGSFTPGSAGTNYFGSLTTPSFNIPAAGLIFFDPRTLSPRTAEEQYNGVGYLVLMSLKASATEELVAFKRVVVSTRPTKNQNPTFSSVIFDGVPAGGYTLTNDSFQAKAGAAAGSAETYSVQNRDGTFVYTTESLTITWLITSGEMQFSRTDPGALNRFTPEAVRPALTSFIVILRDDRGGMSVVDFHKP